jgi:hypothetical protein
MSAAIVAVNLVADIFLKDFLHIICNCCRKYRSWYFRKRFSSGKQAEQNHYISDFAP